MKEAGISPDGSVAADVLERVAQMDASPLTPSLRKMLMRIFDGSRTSPLLELTITAAGGSEGTKLNKLKLMGLVERVIHPTVRDSFWDRGADALVVTEAGRAALAARSK